MPKNNPSKLILKHCHGIKVAWLQESTSFGGHSIPKGGHRRVSGIVRASIKEETRHEIQEQLEDYNENVCPSESASYIQQDKSPDKPAE